ncbi:MAG: hypothetical protein JXM79_13965 [Sedimentisphaerales bacterium]|nr:hypothetical protein [Sedimentisphaerales bacterium]
MAEDRIKCPVCAELIKRGAKKCRFCGEWLGGSEEDKEDIVHREHFEPPDDEHEDRHEDRNGDVEDKSPEPVTVNTVGTALVRNKRPFPWLRIILFFAYAGIIVALVCSERTARQMLRDAKAEGEALNDQAAFDIYSTILHKYPFTLAVIETQRSLRGLSEAHGFPMPRPSWLEMVEDVLAKETTVCEVYLLSFVGWPACAVLLALVFLTRILRPGTALFVLVLLAVAVAGSVVQLSWYGRLLTEPVANVLFEKPLVLYGLTYALLVITALMTLTATRKRRHKVVPVRH